MKEEIQKIIDALNKAPVSRENGIALHHLTEAAKILK